MENMEDNSEKIEKIWKKSRLNCEMIWKIWKKSKLISKCAHPTRPGEALRVTFEWIFRKEHGLCYNDMC